MAEPKIAINGMRLTVPRPWKTGTMNEVMSTLNRRPGSITMSAIFEPGPGWWNLWRLPEPVDLSRWADDGGAA